MEIEDQTIAMLIDADNISHNSLESIFQDISRYGRIIIRRIYGDWTNQRMKAWTEKLAKFSFRPVQKFADAKGKNSTDIALIIDAMDILHDKKVDCFCLVSSDSDFTGLARRIREDKLHVIGVGTDKSVTSLIQSCDIFRTVDNLNLIYKNKSTSKKQTQKQPSENQKSSTVKKEIKELIDKAYKMTEENNSVLLARLSRQIQKLDSSFDPRVHGFKNYLDIFDRLKKNYTYQYENEDTKMGGRLWIKKESKN